MESPRQSGVVQKQARRAVFWRAEEAIRAPSRIAAVVFRPVIVSAAGCSTVLCHQW